jgi:hypothetical protein
MAAGPIGRLVLRRQRCKRPAPVVGDWLPPCQVRRTCRGAVALRRGGTRWSCDLRLDQMANASSWNAAATRRFVGSSAASS